MVGNSYPREENMGKILNRCGMRLLSKIYIGLVCATAVMLFGFGVTASAETGAFTVTGGVEGIDYTYASGVLTINTAEELTISTSGSTTDRIQVTGSSGANIILSGVDINNAASAGKGALLISGSGDVNITLADGTENVLKAGESCAAIQKDGTGLLTISGSGSLKAVGGTYAAGIGGADSKSASDITISGGVIDVMGGQFAAGIGGGWSGSGRNITISGGAVTADSSGGASIGGGYDGVAENIVITGGTVLAKTNEYWPNTNDCYYCPGIGSGLSLKNANEYNDGVKADPTDGEGNKVYLLVINNPANAEVIVDGVVFTPSQHPDTTSLYLYLTAGEHSISVGGVITDYFFNPESGQWTEPGTEFLITGDGLRHGTDFIYPADTGVLTVLTDKAITIANVDPDTATNNVIAVADGVSANITLNGVNISTAERAALEIIENTGAGAVSITLADGSENTLISTGAYAGLQKEGASGSLSISGSGTLVAEGGTAGIGGDSTHNITIVGTTVTARGGAYGGAGIGGSDGTVSDISISTSVVIAEGGDNGAGIGAVDGTVNDISISNSVVTATGSGEAAGIGGASSAAVSKIVIDGGSVKVTGGSDASFKIGGSAAVVPTNKLENYVYLLTIDNPDGKTVLIDGTEYVPQKHSSSDSSLYVYLPADDYVVTVGDTDTPYYFDSSTKSFRSPQLKVTGGRLGTDYIFNAGIVTITSDKALTIENFDKLTPASDTIAIADDVTANITLDGVNIDSADVAFDIGENASVSIALAAGSDNVLVSLADGIALGDNSSVSISGNGWLATEGGIVGGTGTSVHIDGCSLTADSIDAAEVVIEGGSVKADSIAPPPVNSDGESVYLLKIANAGGRNVYIDETAYTPIQHGINGDTNVYAYLTGEIHTVEVAKHYTYHFDALTSTFYLPDLNVYGDGVVYGTDYTYSDGVVTILKTTPVIIENIDPDTATDDTILIAGGIDADVTLDGVNIDASGNAVGTAALKIVDSSAGVVLITLADGSENYLKSSSEAAGIQKNGTSGALEIAGSGRLTVNGGWSAAGIGGGKGSATGNIIISGGVVDAKGGDYGAGIGGGKGGSASDIIIENADVTARGGDRGAGIGGGDGMDGGSSFCSNVTITDATVNAVGGVSSAGIGGGYGGNGSNITIYSGTVRAQSGSNAAGIGGGWSGTGSYITINGGSVEAVGNGGGAAIGGGYGASGYELTVNGGSVTADSGNSGACFGGGYNGVGSDIVIDGGSVLTLPGANAFGGGSRKDAVVPENADGEKVYLLTLSNPDNKTILIDNEQYLPKQHSADDTNVYAYLTGEQHNVKLGDEQTKTYIYDQHNKIFVVIASDLAVTGGVYGVDYTYPVDTGILTILTAAPMTISNSADVDVTDHTIIIDSEVDAVLTLNGVDISASGAAIVTDGGNVSITLAEGSENLLASLGAAAIAAGGTGSLTITGEGTLKASGTVGISAEDASLTLDNCVITADGGITAVATIIKGGSVKADSVTAQPTDGNTDVYLLTVNNADNKALYIDNIAYAPSQHSIDGDKNVYAYLTGDTHVVKLGNEETVYIFDDTNKVFRLPDMLVTGSGVSFGTDYTYEDGVLTILSDTAITIANNPDVAVTSDVIAVKKDVSADITLDGVNIEAVSGAAFSIEDNSTADVKITLADGSQNSFTSAGDNAGLQKNGTSGTLEITGSTGKLTANGSGYGAGIGGSLNSSAANITISGGVIEATAETGGAGIGGGSDGGTAASIVISGGTVVAEGGQNGGAGIGGGAGGTAADISISGGTIIATGNGGAGIGGGTDASGSDITISGGSVTAQSNSWTAQYGAAGIGGGTNADATDIVITGGSVLAVSGGNGANDIGGGKGKPAVIPTDGTNNVYLLTISNPSGDNVTVNGDKYLPKSHSDTDTNIYAFLSGAEDQTVRIGGEKTTYRYSEEKGKFLIVPTPEMFNVELPTELTYDGTAKIAHITPADNTMTYTVKYYKDGEVVTDTSATGTYYFKITVIGDDKYASDILDDESWTFTVTGAPLDPPASVVYTVGYGYKAEDAVFDDTTGAMAVGNTIVTGEWALEYDGYFTESGDAYTAVFTPDDTNYLSFAFTSVRVNITPVDPVVEADPKTPRVIPGKSVSFTFTAEHPKYPEFTEGLPTELISISDGTDTVASDTYTVAKTAEIGSTIDITVNIAGVDGKYNPSSAESVITVAEKFKVNDQISVDTAAVIYGDDPEPQGIFSGDADGEAEWTYSFAAGDVGADGNFGTLAEIYNEYGALDVGTYTVKARYEDAAHIGIGYGTFVVTAKPLTLTFNGDITKKYDGTKAVVGYTVSAEDFVLGGLVGGAERYIDTLGVTILYKDENVGTDKELIIAVINNHHVLTTEGAEDINYTVPDSIDFTGAVIERRPVTVTADNCSKVYGEEDPAFTWTADDLVNGEMLNGEPDREAGEDASEYSITQGTITNDNNANYDITFVPAVLTISKAAAPAAVELEAKHSWGATGAKSLAITGIPADIGTLYDVTASVTDADDIMDDTAVYSDGMVTYTLNENTRDQIGSAAQIVLTIPCQNYEDITVNISVILTAKEDQAAPELKLTFTLDPDGTFTTTIAAVEGAEYKFGDGEWTTVNYIKGVEPSTYVTAYIRMAETESHNASPAASVTELSPKSTVQDPVFTPVPSAFKTAMDVTITCPTPGASIYYTTDGSDPLTNGILYTAPFNITMTTHVKAVAVKESMLDSVVIEGTFTRQPDYIPGVDDPSDDPDGPGGGGGGTGGGDSGGGAGDVSSGYGESPSVGGVNHNWYQIAEMILALPVGGEFTVELNGCIDVPDFVIKAIADRDALLTFEYNSINDWFVDGKNISDTDDLVNADLNIIYPVRIPAYELRGKAKFKFRMDNTNVPSELITDVDIKNAGEFANLYRYVDGELIYVQTALIDENGLARFALTEKGDYVIMASKYSDLLGDVNNDGRVNALDAGAILRDIVRLEAAPNIIMGDFNADTSINAMDAGAILSWIVGA